MGALLNAELGHITLGQFGGSADKASDSLKDLKTIIAKLPPELVDAAGATEDAAGATQSLGQQLGRTGANAAQMGKKLAAAKKDTRSAAQSFVGLGSNLDKAKVSLSDWIKSLQRQANALRDFRVNAVNAAKKGLDEGLIASLNKAGPAGALRMKQLGDATKTQIDAANKAWRSQQHQVAVSTNVIASLIAASRTSTTPS
jgi:ABC-type transporter Mla subunit MlaD